MKACLSLLLSCTALSLAACSQKKSDNANCAAGIAPTPVCQPIDYGSLDPAPVSFQTDLFPKIQTGCNLQFCHATKPDGPDPILPSAGLYLGPEAVDNPANQPSPAMLADDIALVMMSLMADSTTVPTQQRVVPMHPEQSFLMLKLTGCAASAGACMLQKSEYIVVYGQGCGDVMPPTCDQVVWDASGITLFARWIAQGAQNN
ncbi:MAG TPA: hypothetical protein VGI10_24005 [Polyangiaceae bacterium]|jgi:hypothetical protein